MLKFSILLTLAGLQMSCAAAVAEYAPIVELAAGKVRGVIQEVEDDGPVQKVQVYQGIRYGKLLS
jgi:hypothetical protein